MYIADKTDIYSSFLQGLPGNLSLSITCPYSSFYTFQINNEYSEYPVIDNNNPNALKGAYKYDASGFVNEVLFLDTDTNF